MVHHLVHIGVQPIKVRSVSADVYAVHDENADRQIEDCRSQSVSECGKARLDDAVIVHILKTEDQLSARLQDVHVRAKECPDFIAGRCGADHQKVCDPVAPVWPGLLEIGCGAVPATCERRGERGAATPDASDYVCPPGASKSDDFIDVFARKRGIPSHTAHGRSSFDRRSVLNICINGNVVGVLAMNVPYARGGPCINETYRRRRSFRCSPGPSPASLWTPNRIALLKLELMAGFRKRTRCRHGGAFSK